MNMSTHTSCSILTRNAIGLFKLSAFMNRNKLFDTQNIVWLLIFNKKKKSLNFKSNRYPIIMPNNKFDIEQKKKSIFRLIQRLIPIR